MTSAAFQDMSTPFTSRLMAMVRSLSAAFTRQPDTPVTSSDSDPRVDAVARAIVRVGNRKVELLYVIMTGIGAFGDYSHLDERAREAIRDALDAVDRV
jgi:hypothetical protein